MNVLIDHNPAPWLTSIGIPVVFLLVLYLLKRIVLVHLSNNKHLQASNLLTLSIKAISKPIDLVLLSLALIGANYLLVRQQLVDQHISDMITPAAQVCVILSILLFVERLCIYSIERYAQSSSALQTSQSIVRGTIKVVIVLLGLLIILGTLGISVTPIIASLGITSLAVALALQPTLENFFSGVQLIIDKPIRVGDFIELESKQQGFVEKIGWRSTWIKMLPNNVIIVPNSALSQSKIINYYYPEKQLSVPVDVGVHYHSDLEKVEQVTLEVARHVLKTHKWGVADYDTFVVFHTFDSSSINFTVMLRAQEYFNRFFIKSTFIKALHERFKQEGIVIPYPIRAINTEQETPVAMQPITSPDS